MALRVRIAVIALAAVLAFVQTAWARAAVCGAARDAHAACKCCGDREPLPQPVIRGECCAIDEAPAHRAASPVPGVRPLPVILGAPPAAASSSLPAPPMAPVAAAPADIEARSAGPPLWLRTLSLRL